MLEVRDYGVKVSTVNPGSVATDFSPSARQESWRLDPADVANAVAAVLHTDADVLIHQLEVRTLRPPRKADA
jgi:short-subunit dehydrogenase